MVEQIKVMMDEQTKLVLKQLEGALLELLSPLKNLDAGGGSADTNEATQLVVGEIRKLSNLVEDAVDDIKRKMIDVCDNQSELFRKVADLSAKQDAVQTKLQMVQQLSPAKSVKAQSKRSKPKVSSKAKILAKGKAAVPKGSAKKSNIRKIAVKKPVRHKVSTKKSKKTDKKNK